MASQRILGVDPSLTSTGLATVEGGRVLQVSRIRSKKKGHERIQEILGGIHEHLTPGTVVGIEGTAMGAKGASVVQIFGLWGIITHRLWEWKVPYYVVTPTARAKYATGSGSAGKDEVLAAVIRRHLDVQITGNDEADALTIAAMGARKIGHPVDGKVSAACQSTLEKVDWRDVWPM